MQIAIAVVLCLMFGAFLCWVVRNIANFQNGLKFTASILAGVLGTLYPLAYIIFAATLPADQEQQIQRFIEVKKMVEETEPGQSLMELYFEAYHLNRELQKQKANLESWFSEPHTADGWADLEPIRIPAVSLPGSEVKEE